MADQKKYTTKLVNSRVLIIGGSSGMGYGVAEACLESGAIVTISSSNPTRVNTSVESLRKSYPSASSNVHGLVVDLSKPETLESEIEKLFKETAKSMEGRKLDHVIFTAADALSMMPLSEMTMPKILQVGQIRFFAPLMVGKYCAQYLVSSPKSSYTITTGSVSERPVPNWSVVGSYAGGHHSMVRNLALDMKPIRVNGISPGVVDTDMWQMGEEEKKAFFKQCEERMATGVAGRPEDVVESFLAVLKDCNMDGAVARTDGGTLIM